MAPSLRASNWRAWPELEGLARVGGLGPSRHEGRSRQRSELFGQQLAGLNPVAELPVSDSPRMWAYRGKKNQLLLFVNSMFSRRHSTIPRGELGSDARRPQDQQRGPRGWFPGLSRAASWWRQR